MQLRAAAMSSAMALAGGNRGDVVSGNGSAQIQTSGSHDSSQGARRATPTSPRRAVVTLDSQPKVSATVYDKQLLWKQHGQRKVEHKTLELLSQEDAECTFNPKINKTPASLVYQQQLVRKARAPTSAMQAALSPTASEFLMSDGVSYSDCSSQYTDSPRTMRSTEMEAEAEAATSGFVDVGDDELAAGPMFPTESHESSILLHLARQERAREEAMKAHQKLVSRQPAKDFTKVTTTRPFDLSVTNRKPRSTSASPTNRTTRSVSQPKGRTGSTTPGGRQAGKRRPHGAASASEDASGDHGSSENVAVETSHTVVTAMENQALVWQKERSSLLSIIETQRLELEQRDQSQADAVRLADSFSVTMQSFAQRLEVVERTTAAELTEVKQLLAKQTAATELLLHALGLNSTSPAQASSSLAPSKSSGGGLTLSPSSPPSSPPQQSLGSTASFRRDTK